MSYTVVIPSRDLDKAAKCVQAIYRAGEEPRILIIDDDFNSLSYGELGESEKHPGVEFHMGIKPFVYARNCNLGIKAAADNDVILLNDDALLQTPNGFRNLARITAIPDIGLVGCTCNSIGNPHQYRTMPRIGQGLDIDGLWKIENSGRALAFVCVYIPRRTIDTVGLLDERFTTYGWEDTDYCRRVKQAGLKLAISEDCFVDHLTLSSSFRGPGGASGDIEPGRRIYIDKWGDDGL